MKESIQRKIDEILQLAKTQGKASAPKNVTAFRSNNDSLSKVIRNEKEASIFFAELNAAVLMAKQK